MSEHVCTSNPSAWCRDCRPDADPFAMQLGLCYRHAPEPQHRYGFIPHLGQRQDSLVEQARDLVWVANRLGMYDAADYLGDSLRDNGHAETPGSSDQNGSQADPS